MREECLDGLGPEIPRVTATVEEDVSPDPATIGLFSARAVASNTERVAYAIHEARRSRGGLSDHADRTANCVPHPKLAQILVRCLGDD